MTMAKPKQPERWVIALVEHHNFPNVGDRHSPDDCSGGGRWPCDKPGKNKR